MVKVMSVDCIWEDLGWKPLKVKNKKRKQERQSTGNDIGGINLPLTHWEEKNKKDKRKTRRKKSSHTAQPS